MQETLKQVIENTINGINIFGEDASFKYEEGGFGDSIYNFERRLIEVRPKSRILFRKSFVIVDHKDKCEFKEDMVRAQFLKELVAYAVQTSRYKIDKLHEIKR